MAADKWFAVQSVFLIQGGAVLEDAEQSYEERITVWQAGSVDEAVEKVRIEAEQCGESSGYEQVDFMSTYEMFDPLSEGAEVWSITRSSWLPPDEYIKRFVDEDKSSEE